MRKIITLVLVAGVILLIVFTSKPPQIGSWDPLLEETGWTWDQFIRWLDETQCMGVRKIRAYQEDGDFDIISLTVWENWERKELLNLEDPNKHFKVAALNSPEDVNGIYPIYEYDWCINIPKEDVPEPVIRILKRVSSADVGKFVGEVIPYLDEPMAIACFLKEEGQKPPKDPPSYSENIRVKFFSISDNKLEFLLRTEPFILSSNPGIRGRIDGIVVLPVPEFCENNLCEIGVFKPKERGAVK